MLPFRDLLKPSNRFHWDEHLQNDFDQSKTTIINEIAKGVRIFDKSKPTCLATDWSKHGIGYWLFQKRCSCPSNDLFCCNQGWQIILVGSRFTHPAESRYAPIEGEALAVADALDKASTLCTRLQEPHHCSGPQATPKDLRRQIPGSHQQHQAEEPKREDTQIPVPNSLHTRSQEQST